MRTINASKCDNKTVTQFLEEAAEYGEQLNVWTEKGNLVVMSEEEYRGLVETIHPLPNEKPHPVRGSGKGKIWIADDFNEPLEDFKEYME
jgi:PHD/YefM family antitoxin component YafN of YafNO toxin-antitoxin module